MLIKKSFYFIRHGETEHNAQEICAGGSINSSLTENGKKQARELASALKKEEFCSVFSSPLQRTIDTAYLASGIYPQIVEELREWDIGDFNGKHVDIFSEYLKVNQPEDKIQNGESRKEFFQRSVKAINNILENNKKPLIVAHGGTHWAILDALNIPFEFIGNCECFLFNYADGIWKKIPIILDEL